MKIYSSNLQVLANGHSPRNNFVNTLEHIMFKDIVDLLQVSKALSPKMKSMVLEFSSHKGHHKDLPIKDITDWIHIFKYHIFISVENKDRQTIQLFV